MAKENDCGSNITYTVKDNTVTAVFDCMSRCNKRWQMVAMDNNVEAAKTIAITSMAAEQLLCPRGKMGGPPRPPSPPGS